MKLLGFRRAREMPMPADGPRDPIAPLLREDPIGYRSLVDHWIGDDPRLAPWRDRIASGDALVVLTGQQPALLGGPLYTLYKTWTAIETARRLRAAGTEAIAAFWCVGDDTDHDEVGWAAWPRRGKAPQRVSDPEPYRGERIGDFPAWRMVPVLTLVREDGFDESVWREIDTAIHEPAIGWAGFLAWSLKRLAGSEPLLFVDGNDPRLIRLAQPLLRRFVPIRETIAKELDREANGVRSEGASPVLSGEEGRRALFVADGPGRRPLGEHESPSDLDLLLPNVVSRPILQEHALSVHSVVCGEGEIAYRRLLGPIYRTLDRRAAPLSRRFAATLLPQPWGVSAEAPEPAATVEDPDGMIEKWAIAGLDPDLLSRLASVRERSRADLGDLAGGIASIDRGLLQLLDSIAGKIDFQLGRIEEGVRQKARTAVVRRYPELAHLREFVRPRAHLQERIFTLWTPFLWEGWSAIGDLDDAVRVWMDRGAAEEAFFALEGEGP